MSTDNHAAALAKVQGLPQTEQGSEAGPVLDTLQLRRVFGKFTTGVTIVTADSGGKPVGMTCNSFASVSLDPPLLLWSLRKASASYDDFVKAEYFAVNILASDQIELSGKFAKSSADKFAGVDFERGQGGAPIFPGTTASFECRVEVAHEGGDHLIIVGRIVGFNHSERAPLVFSDGRYVEAVERPAMRTAAAGTASNVPQDPLHEYISVLLLRSFHRVLDHLADAREEIGVTINESRLLTVARAYPNKTLEVLMPHTYMASSAMEDALNTLQQRGYLAVDPEGRVLVTDLGTEKVQAYNARFKDVEAYLFRSLRSDQIDAFRGVLMSIMNSEPLRKDAAA
jgi:flavin reductase (DIM6/NTAB) family NADH-FMN oxidoreductase RutF/DNA-binding MarR family transcriptional regulator